MPEIHEALSDSAISIQDVYEALVSLDVQKSPGMDKISPRVLTNCAEALCEPFHHLFMQSLCYASLSRWWKIHKVVSVFKSGDSIMCKKTIALFPLTPLYCI